MDKPIMIKNTTGHVRFFVYSQTTNAIDIIFLRKTPTWSSGEHKQLTERALYWPIEQPYLWEEVRLNG